MELECPICLKVIHVEGEIGSRHICPNCKSELMLARVPTGASEPSCFSCSFQETAPTFIKAVLFSGMAFGWLLFFTRMAGVPITFDKKLGLKETKEITIPPTTYILTGVLTAGATKLTYDFAKEILGWK